MKCIKIGGSLVGPGQAPFIVAEAGINHNGELENAYQMIRAAKAAGVSAVKFQTFKASEFIADPALTFTYRSQGKEVTESMLEMFRRYEFTRDEWRAISKRCADEDIAFLSTPQNRSDLDLLLELGIDAIKIGSDDFTNIPLLTDYASTGLPLIVSSGMSDLAEVHQALDAIGALDGYPAILLHCTSQYPTPPEDANLNKIGSLNRAFPMVLIGFSDHTQGALASSLAVAKGAVFFEKHFTLDRGLPGPDHWFSEDPASLMEWAAAIKLSGVMLGSGIIRPTAAEQKMKGLARRSVVALEDIKAGELLTAKNTGLRRPGTGMPPVMLLTVLGQRAAAAFKAGHVFGLGDFGAAK